MFGYITPVKSELKVKDFERFRSYYCGLCLSIKNKFGNIPRIGLNYDATFFAVLMDGLNMQETNILITPCMRHPIEKTVSISKNIALDYATDLNIALIYYKVLDDARDDRDLKSLVLSKTLKPYYKKISFQNLDSIIKDNLDKLHILEVSGGFSSIDEISHPFSHIIGEVLKECPFELKEENKTTRNKLYNFGYSFGKWIYLIDALDDLKDDMTHGKFNPIAKVYNKNNLSYPELWDAIKEKVDFILAVLAYNCSEILLELPIVKNNDIIENVINLGLMEKYRNILSKL